MSLASPGPSTSPEDLAVLEARLARAWRAGFPGRELGPFHLAVSADRLRLFHSPSLEVEEPEAWAALLALARDVDATPTPCRRMRREAVAQERRRALVTAIVLGAGVLARGGACVAAPTTLETPAVVTMVAPPGHSEMHLPPERRGPSVRAISRARDGTVRITAGALAPGRRISGVARLDECGPEGRVGGRPCIDEVPAQTGWIAELLISRLANPPSTHLAAELRAVAAYYGQHEEIRDLLGRLRTLPWSLSPRPGTWMTEPRVSGDRLVSATVWFDLGAGAVMHFASRCEGQPACTAMPADALLHELLHVYLMHTRTAAFLASARKSFYPHEHEAEVISLENRLYRALEKRDGLPRPARDGHGGRLASVSCALCWGPEAPRR